MNNLRHQFVERHYADAAQDGGSLIIKLEREIACLERQLERLVMLDGSIDQRTQNTYSEMISSRRDILTDLGY
ncbi:MAG: hypothetical protein K6L76_13295 [Agarilytica sp.]